MPVLMRSWTELCRTVELTSKKWLMRVSQLATQLSRKSPVYYIRNVCITVQHDLTQTLLVISLYLATCDSSVKIQDVLQSYCCVWSFVLLNFQWGCDSNALVDAEGILPCIKMLALFPDTPHARWQKDGWGTRLEACESCFLTEGFFIDTTLIKWQCDQNTGWSHLRFLHERCFIWVWVLCNNVILFLWLVLRCCIVYQARPCLFPGGWELHCRISRRLPMHNLTHPPNIPLDPFQACVQR